MILRLALLSIVWTVDKMLAGAQLAQHCWAFAQRKRREHGSARK